MSVQSRIAANVCLSRNASPRVRHLTASKEGKRETYLMLRLRKGMRSQTKRMSHLASTAAAVALQTEQGISLSHKETLTHTHRHTDTYTLLSRKRAHRFLLCCTLSKSVCLLFPLCALFQVQLPRNEVGNRHGSSPKRQSGWLASCRAA